MERTGIHIVCIIYAGPARRSKDWGEGDMSGWGSMCRGIFPEKPQRKSVKRGQNLLFSLEKAEKFWLLGGVNPQPQLARWLHLYRIGLEQIFKKTYH